jgi:hypothetical protein
MELQKNIRKEPLHRKTLILSITLIEIFDILALYDTLDSVLVSVNNRLTFYMQLIINCISHAEIIDL